MEILSQSGKSDIAGGPGFVNRAHGAPTAAARDSLHHGAVLPNQERIDPWRSAFDEMNGSG
jgi:hypothetical protein